ncbi:MAG: APC family permease [Mycobacteriales bacterium]
MASLFKRIFVGRPIDTADASHALLPKKLALPVFSSDALSSVAYATQEILLVLALGGAALLHLTSYMAAGVVLLLVIVTISYRQTVKAYPSGGGAYIVAHKNIGQNAGLVAASALLIDYVLTVSVSIAAGVAAITSAAPELAEHKVALSLGFILFVTLINLRGVKESGTFFAIPTYGFVVGIYALLGVGLFKLIVDGSRAIQSESAGFEIHGEHKVAGIAVVLLALRAFSSGCTALTGVEAISNGVPAFKKPKSDNARKTLLIMATLSITMFIGITAFALVTNVHVAEHARDVIDPLTGRPPLGFGVDGYDPQKTVVAQIAAAVFGNKTFAFYYIQAFTAGILILAANTAFQDFPRLASILAKDKYLPRQLANRGDRLVYSNGVFLLAGFASLLIVLFGAEVTRLIQLYIVGVFVSFTLSQWGMVRHWQREARDYPNADRGQLARAKAINTIGAVMTALVLVIVLYSKFTHGAYIIVIAIPILFALMRGVNRHYRQVSEQIHVDQVRSVLPSRNHAVVLVSSLSVPTVRALNYARSIHAHTLQAVSIAVDPEAAKQLEDAWDRNHIDIPLVRVASPYREVTKPLVAYINGLRRKSDNDVVTVILPEFVVTRWWEQLLHGQSAFLIKLALLRTPGVVVTNVPWHLNRRGRRQRATGAADEAGELVVATAP